MKNLRSSVGGFVHDIYSASKILGCSTDMLKTLCNDNKIKHTKKFQYKFLHKDLIAFLHSDVDVEKYILEAELKFQKYNEERKKRGFLN
jgi:hypothetical protein